MNAYELADKLQMDKAKALLYVNTVVQSAEMLRQQADRIAHLEMLLANRNEIIDKLDLTTPQIKELSDEEIYKLAGEFWIEGSFDDGELDYVGFARAILKKASFTCNGFCGEQECKENKESCNRIKKASEK